MKHFDHFNGAVALAFLGATLAGWTISDWAALAALVYSLILIGQKIYQGIAWLHRKSAA